MIRVGCKVWAVAIVAFALPACATVQSDSHHLALCPELPCTDAPASCRNRVHIVVIDGLDPLGLGDVTGLRAALVARGFGSVHAGRVFHGSHLESRARAIRADDPDARFVVVGYSLGAAAADGLASRLARDGIPVDALVTIGPVYPFGSYQAGPGSRATRRIVLTPAGSEAVSVADSEAEHIAVHGAGHYSLPTHAVTVGAIVDVLKEVAARIPPAEYGAAVLPLIDDPAPVPAILPGPKRPLAPAADRSARAGR